ncbi:MAG: hypothetical protein HFJ43_05395 [Clostridia bacterium]|nr:hypothetical protein [Clostridia bacterium]
METVSSPIIYHLRVLGMNPAVPGYPMLIKAVEQRIKRGMPMTDEEIVQMVQLQSDKMIVPKAHFCSNRDDYHQWMIESIRAIGCDKTLSDFVECVASKINR